jgi:hypothetical protein
MNNCLFCLDKTINPKFCNKSCAAKYNNKLRKPRTLESRKKTSEKLKGRSNIFAKNPDLHPEWCGIFYHPCKNCYKTISNPKRLTCSIECRDSIRSKNGTLKKRLEYNGQWFQSSWEIKIAIFLDTNQIRWTQPHKRLRWYDSNLQKNRTYLPDFFLIDYQQYLDVKNPIKQLQDSKKLDQLKRLFPLFVGDIVETKKFVARLAGLEPACIH